MPEFTFEDVMRAECNRLAIEGNVNSTPDQIAEAKAELAKKMAGSNMFAIAGMMSENFQSMLDAELERATANQESLAAEAKAAEEAAAIYAQRAIEAAEAAEAARQAAQAKRAKITGEVEPDEPIEPDESDESDGEPTDFPAL